MIDAILTLVLLLVLIVAQQRGLLTIHEITHHDLNIANSVILYMTLTLVTARTFTNT